MQQRKRLTQARSVMLGGGSVVLLGLLAAYNRVVAPSGMFPGLPSFRSPQDFAASWSGYMSTWIQPLQDSATSVVGLLVGFTVLARLLSLLPLWNGGPSSDSFGLRTALSLGIAFILLSALALISLTPYWHLAVITGLTGSTLLAAYLARRMALRLEVKSKDGQADVSGTGQLAAYVAELGKESPQGRLMPRGSDATGLKDSDFVGIPSNPFFAAILALLQGLVGTAPWRAVVCVAADGALEVEVTRNGQSVESVSIDRAILRLPVSAGAATGVASDLYRMAAAVILIEVSKRYAGFDGLYGATDWRSVGRHFIATTEAADDRGRAIELLEYAVYDDPKDRLASLTLKWQRHRYATDGDEIQAYATWLLGQLDAIVGEPAGFDALRRRFLINYVTAACTLRSVPGHAQAEPEAADRALSLLRMLHDDTSDLALGLRHHAALAVWRLSPASAGAGLSGDFPWRPDEWMGDDWLERANRDADPRVKYALACYYAQQQIPQVEHSVSLLEDALVLPELRRWAADDPSLLPVRRNTTFALLVQRVPRTTWLDVLPFAPHRARLEAVGLVRLSQLTTDPATPGAEPSSAVDLAEYLGVGALELSVLLRAAAFCVAVEAHSADFREFRVEVMAELLAHGVTDIQQVVAMNASARQALADDMSAAIGGRCVCGPDRVTVAHWLGRFSLDIL